MNNINIYWYCKDKKVFLWKLVKNKQRTNQEKYSSKFFHFCGEIGSLVFKDILIAYYCYNLLISGNSGLVAYFSNFLEGLNGINYGLIYFLYNLSQSMALNQEFDLILSKLPSSLVYGLWLKNCSISFFALLSTINYGNFN